MYDFPLYTFAAVMFDIMLTQPVTTYYIAIVFNLPTFLAIESDAARIRYVRSNTSDPCPNIENLCLTFAEYANETNQYFVHDAIFNFSPGIHHLNFSLNLSNINHLSFHGLSVDGVSTIKFDTNASIIVQNCSHVEISSVTLNLICKYTYCLMFEHSHSIHITNIYVFGSGKNGRYSAIMSHNSSVNIIDSIFAYVSGTIGAVILMSKSTVILGGNSFLEVPCIFLRVYYSLTILTYS